MSEEVLAPPRRSTSKLHLRNLRHGKGSHTRLHKLSRNQIPSLNENAGVKAEEDGKSKQSEQARNRSLDTQQGSPGNGSQRQRRLSGTALVQGSTARLRKSVIQLEHSESDGGTDFEDTDEEEPQNGQPVAKSRPVMPRRNSSGLSVGIHPVEPTPPQISNETVVTVTSVAEMASALQEGDKKLRFLREGDLVSSAMTKSHSSADLARIVGDTTTRTQQKIRLGQQRPMEYHFANGDYVDPPERREFERVLLQYINAKAVANPVIRSLERVRALQALPGANGRKSNTRESLSPLGISHNRIAALSATTLNQMSDYQPGQHNIDGSTAGPASSMSMSNYLLHKMWTQGWEDPDDVGGSPESIPTTQTRSHQRISAPQWTRQKPSNDSIKLV